MATIYDNGTAHCEDCGALCWQKDLKDGICYDCFYKRYKDAVKNQLPLFQKGSTNGLLPKKTIQKTCQ